MELSKATGKIVAQHLRTGSNRDRMSAISTSPCWSTRRVRLITWFSGTPLQKMISFWVEYVPRGYEWKTLRRCFSSMYTEIQPTHKCILCARQDIAFSTKKNLPLHCYRLQLEIGRYIILLQINRSNYYALLYVLWFYFSILHSFLEYSKINSMEFLSIFFLSGRFFAAFFSISFSHFTILT